MRPLAALVAAALVCLPVAAADWASFHNDALGTGFVKDSTYPVYEDIWWSVKTPRNQQIYASPVVKDNVVVVADRGGLVRGLDAESGRELWNHTMAAAVEGTPAIAGERVYVVDVQGNLRALNLRDGRIETTASTPVGPTQGSIREHQGKLFIGNNAGQMRAYYANTLQILWTFDLASVFTTYAPPPGNPDGPSTCSNPLSAQPIYGAPAVYGGRVFFGSFNHYVVAVDEDGLGNGRTTPLWIYKTGDIVASSPSVRVIDTNSFHVVVGSYDGKLYSFNGGQTSTTNACTPGSPNHYVSAAFPAWTFSVPSGVERKFESSPAVAGDKIIFGGNNGHTYAVKASDGSKLWEQERTGSPLAPVTSSPAVANNVVVVGSKDKNVYWLDATTGEIRKSFAAQGAVGTSPAIEGDRAYISSTDGVTYMFGPKVPPRPDLVVLAVAADHAGISVIVANAGDLEAGASKLRITVDGNFLAEKPIGPLAPGANVTVTHPATLAAGARVIRADADFGAPDAVKESDESNNARAATLTIGAPPPPPPAPVVSTQTTTTGKGKIPMWDLAAPLAIVGAALLLRRRRKA